MARKLVACEGYLQSGKYESANEFCRVLADKIVKSEKENVFTKVDEDLIGCDVFVDGFWGRIDDTTIITFWHTNKEEDKDYAAIAFCVGCEHDYEKKIGSCSFHVWKGKKFNEMISNGSELYYTLDVWGPVPAGFNYLAPVDLNKKNNPEYELRVVDSRIVEREANSSSLAELVGA